MRKYKKMSLKAFRKALSETDATRYLVMDDNYRSLLVVITNLIAKRQKQAEEEGLESLATMYSESWNHLYEVTEKYELDF